MIIYILAYLLLSTFGIVFIKLGSEFNTITFTKNVLGIQMSIYTVIGLLFYIVSFFLWVIILQKYNLSYISPILTGIAYILIAISSVVVLHESISLYQGIGMGVILIGVIFMNIKK